MHIWQLQEAKARLSEMLRTCEEEGPQMLSVRGEEERFCSLSLTMKN